jgi:hypothetical protein
VSLLLRYHQKTFYMQRFFPKASEGRLGKLGTQRATFKSRAHPKKKEQLNVMSMPCAEWGTGPRRNSANGADHVLLNSVSTQLHRPCLDS